MNILVFSPPVPEYVPQSHESYILGEICGWLKQEGYDFDQKSLFVECRYRNRFRFQNDFVDLSVFNFDQVKKYLKQGDAEVSSEAAKLANLLDIESYDAVIVPLQDNQVISTRDVGLLAALPVLKESSGDHITIIGGDNITEKMELARFSFVDYIIRGDMEIPLNRILGKEFRNQKLDNDIGLMYMKDGDLRKAEPYQHPIEMKAKPYFERDLLDKYAEVTALKKPVIPYKLGRGCSQDCSFCTYFEDQKYQYKSVNKVTRELDELSQEIGTDYIRFVDQNLFNNPDYLESVAKSLFESNVGVKWGGLGMIVSRSQEFFDTLSRGGCKMIYHGIESASDSVLHRMQKHQTREMIENTLEKETKANIKPFGGFITDYVNETWDEYQETIDFVKNSDCLLGGEAFSLRIYPTERQPLFRNSEDFGVQLLDQSQKNNESDWLGMDGHYNISFKDDKGIKNEAGSRSKIKEKYLQRMIDKHLFFKNYALENPLTMIKLQIRKLYMKDYEDVTYGYV